MNARVIAEQSRVVRAAAEAAEAIRAELLTRDGDDLHVWLVSSAAPRAFALAFVRAHAAQVAK